MPVGAWICSKGERGAGQHGRKERLEHEDSEKEKKEDSGRPACALEGQRARQQAGKREEGSAVLLALHSHKEFFAYIG